MANLLAICGQKTHPHLKLVPMDAPLQGDITQIFREQEQAFRTGCIERDFNQNWTPDENEISTVDIPTETLLFDRIHEAHVTNMSGINRVDIEQDQIKALAMEISEEGSSRILVQRFTKSQILDRGFTLFMEGSSFNRINKTAFRIDQKLVCIVENGLIKFKSYRSLGGFIETSTIVREATREEVSEFLGNDLIEVTHPEEFHSALNSIGRSKIHSILDRGLLEHKDASALANEAIAAGVHIRLRENRIVMPSRSAEINELLHFLNEGRYRSPVSNRPMMANSYRPAESSLNR